MVPASPAQRLRYNDAYLDLKKALRCAKAIGVSIKAFWISSHCLWAPPRCRLKTYTLSTDMGAGKLMSFVSLVSCAAALLSLSLFATRSAAQLALTGQTLVLDNVPYYVPPTAFATVTVQRLRGLPSAGELFPVTVVDTSANLQATVQGYGEVDDVWSACFLEGKT